MNRKKQLIGKYQAHIQYTFPKHIYCNTNIAIIIFSSKEVRIEDLK